MKKFIAALIPFTGLAYTPLYAGVAMDMVTTDASGQQTEKSRIYAQSNKVRIDKIGGRKDEQVSMIFLGEELLMLNHKDKTYVVMDEAMLEQMNSQMSEATKQMEAQLAQVPPEQRAMVEKMMKGQMRSMMPKQSAPPLRVERGGSGEWQTYSCTQYTIYSGNEKTQDICAASLDQIEGSDEVMGAFRSMAAFVKKMSESLPGPMASSVAQNPTGMMDQIEGFPVHTVQFEKGSVSQKISLDSMTEQALEESLFAVPDNYNKQDLFKGR